ncbi:hypothetical protein AAVH_27917 [Aphelenchoides avenae]|nr:hypothetical protein AAVH_27917 [Aphelenchus avenae]
MKKYLSALQRRLVDSEGNPEELRKACQGIEPAALRDEIHLEWHVVTCNATNETHMWNFVRVSSDATQLKRHATANGPEKIVGPDRRLVSYVTKRIGEYKTMLEEKGRSQPWFNKLYTELHLDAHDSKGSLDWLELYVRQSAALTFLGYVANGEMRSNLVFYHTWCVGIVCYE